MTSAQKARLAEIDSLIAQLQQEKESINPYSNLKSYPNKSFGEGWSEPHILARCPSFLRADSKGYDFESAGLGRTEVKSCRLPATTVNQCHPQDCDNFLFAFYDCDECEDYLYLIPSKDFMKFGPSAQHDRTGESCYSMSLSTKKRQALLQDYKITYEELELRAANGGYYVQNSSR